ncbi:twitch domain-containing radical SAM protein [Poseidonocella sedimentorum]|uniref:Radical SAM core domain-containing protein n=1 Tax=Poseidonocella sedimentorum TaxID=871652 RepID=A0A1I6DLC2_9RHOB|nr:twitch domain-containing radical SAM protein [Poseidonocella sedimentorum]SFR06172.1 hypothetical protein SAMN04515673_10455 [Poseidonocella sedimentorum]
MTEPSCSFCVLPWMHLFADEAGTLWPCCRTIGSGLPNIDDATGEPRTVTAPGGLQAAMNTSTMRTLRREMLAGDRPAACERCYRLEDLGGRSHRQVSNARWAETLPDHVASTAPDGRIEADLRTADLRLGNICNLKCRMCSPQSSKALIAEFAKAGGAPETHPYFDRFRRMDWFDNAEFWTALEHDAPNLESINFAGGEPLLIEGMFDFLERMVDTGRAKSLTISYNTNATLLPDRIARLWPAFRAIRLTASVDGVDAINDYIRAPSKWARVDSNLRYFDTHTETLNLSGGFTTNSAIQVLNVFALEPLLHYLLGTLRNNECPNLSIVTHPAHLDTRILPPKLKARADLRLRELIAKLESGWPDNRHRPDLIASVTAIRNHMMGKDRSELVPEFLRWMEVMDSARGQSLARTVPELAELKATAEMAGRPDATPAEPETRTRAGLPRRAGGAIPVGGL